MASKQKHAPPLLLLSLACVSLLLSVTAQQQTVPSGTVLDSDIGQVQEGMQSEEEGLELETLWKKAVKLGKCIFMKKLIDCPPMPEDDYDQR